MGGGETTIGGFHKSSKLRCIDLRNEAIEAAWWRFSTTALYGLCAFFYRFHEESERSNSPRRHHRRRDIPQFFLLKSQTGTVQNKKLTMCVYALQCNGNLLQKALWKLLAGVRIGPNCTLVADVKTKFFCPWGCRQGRFGGVFREVRRAFFSLSMQSATS